MQMTQINNAYNYIRELSRKNHTITLSIRKHVVEEIEQYISQELLSSLPPLLATDSELFVRHHNKEFFYIFKIDSHIGQLSHELKIFLTKKGYANETL
jgi:hypothetical protein